MDLNLKKHKEDLFFLPLGGANEIGMNLNLYQLDGKWLMIDCGVGFADGVPGIDMMTPDISFIEKHRKNLLGIVLTHIHEDHLGAVQYLIERLNVPIYATTLGANFLKSKLSEFKLDKSTDIRIIDGQSELDLKPFKLEFVGLTHSVPEMKALIVKTHKGNVLHTGDWKFDPDPVVGKVSEKEKIKEMGDKGEILALICDSTNVLSKGHSKSEGDLHESLKKLIKGRKGYVGVTTFASNIARLHTIAAIAKECGRKVVLAGWSLHRIHEVARKSGYLINEDNFVSDRELKHYKKDEILVISTGCQGEPMAATKKIATNRHPTIKFSKGDLMIFSSKIIPGNEKKIFRLFDALAKKQIDVMTEQDHFVHVSGHPNQDELREMYELARPKISIPVHGEFVHTKAHCDLARECGVKQVIQIENGLAVKICEKSSKQIGFVESGYIGVDGCNLVNLDSPIISERRKLQQAGIVTISLAINDSLQLASPPRVTCVGSYDIKRDFDAQEFILEKIDQILNEKASDLGLQKDKGFHFLKKKKSNKNLKEGKIIGDLERNLRSKILKIFEDLMGKRPALEVMIHLI